MFVLCNKKIYLLTYLLRTVLLKDKKRTTLILIES